MVIFMYRIVVADRCPGVCCMLSRPTAYVWSLLARAGPWLCCALVAGGCAGGQLPRLDPSGERLFVQPGAPAPMPGMFPPPPGAQPTPASQPRLAQRGPAAAAKPSTGSGAMLPTRPAAGLSLRASGPSQAVAGATVTYRLEVNNPADAAARDVVVTSQAPPGLEYVDSTPAATASDSGQQWRLGEIQPRGSSRIDVSYRGTEPGDWSYCATVTSTGGATDRQCVATRIVAAQLEVTISGPTTGVLGSDAQFEIQVVNRGTSTATGVLVTDRFAEGLRHSASDSAIKRDLADLPSGATGRLSVTFQVAQLGEQCQEVTVTADGGQRGTARTCLTAVEPPSAPAADAAPTAESEKAPPSGVKLSVSKTGAKSQRVGETARFRIEVTNNDERPIENLEIADHFETSLEPTHATEGSTWLKGNALGWKIASLAPGTTVQREIEFKCLRPTPRACIHVTLTADGIEPAADEACVEIAGQAEAAPPAAEQSAPQQSAQISVSVADTADPINVDGETTYQILVSNTSAESVFDVVVTATFGDELKLLGLNGPVHGTVLPNSLRFEAIRELRAGENPLSFEIRMKAVRPGAGRLRADVTSRGQSKAVSAEQSTEILRPK